MLYSSFLGGKNSPRHDHGMRRSQVLPGRLKSQAAQTDSSIMLSGCSRFVVMIFGYIDATSRWYIDGFSLLLGVFLSCVSLSAI